MVLFSIAAGLALVGVEKKGSLIAAFEILEEALKRVMKFIVRLTPLGIFVIATSTAGTMNIDQLSRLQVYIVAYAAAALLMTFGVLPALIMLTPLRYREIFGGEITARKIPVAMPRPNPRNIFADKLISSFTAKRSRREIVGGGKALSFRPDG